MSFRREAPENMGQGFAHIRRLRIHLGGRIVPEPRYFGGIESLRQPVDHAPHPQDTAIGDPMANGWQDPFPRSNLGRRRQEPQPVRVYWPPYSRLKSCNTPGFCGVIHLQSRDVVNGKGTCQGCKIRLWPFADRRACNAQRVRSTCWPVTRYVLRGRRPSPNSRAVCQLPSVSAQVTVATTPRGRKSTVASPPS